MSQPIEIPVKMKGMEALKKQIEGLEVKIAKSFDSKEVEKLEYQLGLSKERLKELTSEVEKSGVKMGDAFGGSINQLKQTRQQIKELQSQFLNSGSELEKAALAEKIGQLKDSIIDANEQAAIFASGSKYEQIGNAFEGIKSNIMNLDFEGASEKAKLLGTAAKGITFKDAIGSLKSLGSTFISLGKALLTNPLFLIAAAIAAIGFAIFSILKKLGFLDKAFTAVKDAIKKLWEWVKKAIEIMSYFNPAAAIANWLIKLYEKDAAEKEALENQRKAADERIKQLNKEEEAIGGKYDFEIRKLKAAGKDTEEVEREKRFAILQTLAAQNDALRALIKSDKATKEQIKEWNENNKKIKQINEEIAIAAIEAEKKASDAAKKAAEERTKIAKEEAKKKAEAAAKYAQDRKNAERLITDLELELIQDTLVKELAVNKEKYKRLIEDTLANENLLQSEKDRIVLDYQKQREANEQKILDADKKANEEKFKEEEQRAFAQKQKIDAIYLESRALDVEDTDTSGLIALKEEAFNIELENLKNQLSTKAITIEEYNATEALMTKKLEDEKERIQKAARDRELALIQRNKEFAEKSTLDSLALVNEFSQQSLDKFKKFNDDIVKNEALTDGQKEILIKKNNDRAKKAFNIQKAANLSAATIATYQSATSAYQSQFLPIPDPTSPVRGAIAAGLAVASGIANIKKIAATKFEGTSFTPSSASGSGGGSGSGGSGSGGGGETVPSFNLFGQANQFNNTSDAKSVESSGGGMVVKAVVSETDITTTQERISKLKQRSEL